MKWLFGLFIALVFLGCSTSRIKEDWFWPFEYRIPPGQELESGAIARSFPGTFNEVWDAALIVLSQSSIIADIKRDTGLIVYFTGLSRPYIVAVRAANGGETNVLFDAGEYQVTLPNKPEVEGGNREIEAERFFSRLATQLLAERRWKLLTQRKSESKNRSFSPLN